MRYVVPGLNTPRRRWFRFSLRTLFVLVTIVGCWLSYQLNWIRQRHEYLKYSVKFGQALNYGPLPVPAAPWTLAILGEKGQTYVSLPFDADDVECDRVRRLFPDSQLLQDAARPEVRLVHPEASFATQADAPE